MLDLPGFVLAAVSEFCPEDACILRVDKCRFRIQRRGATTPQWRQPRQVLELVLPIPLVTAIQGALHNNDQATLDHQAQNLRERVARHLQGDSSGGESDGVWVSVG